MTDSVELPLSNGGVSLIDAADLARVQARGPWYWLDDRNTRYVRLANRKNPMPRKRAWKYDDLAYAMAAAAEFLENEEWPEDDGGAQVAAYREAARRLNKIAKRLYQIKEPRP